jgi:hypothetical protein
MPILPIIGLAVMWLEKWGILPKRPAWTHPPKLTRKGKRTGKKGRGK